MLQGTINIQGQSVSVTASVIPAYNKDYVTLGVTGSFNGFTFHKSYNIRGGSVPPEVVNNFKDAMLKAYQGVQATKAFLRAAGFADVEPGQGE